MCRARGPGTSLFTLWSEGERLRLVALQVLQLNCLSNAVRNGYGELERSHCSMHQVVVLLGI